MADRNLELALRISAKDTGAGAAIRGIDRDVDAMTSRLRQLAGVAATAFGGREILRAADQYATLSARVKLATESQEEFNAAQAALFDISQGTRADLGATVALYSKVAGTLRNIGAEQTDSLDFVQSVNQALALSGTVGAQASGVILQLSQGLGAGAIRGDEFNSVMEGAPRLMQAFADGLGVPIGTLREMAEAGELTTERLFNALAGQREKLAKEYAAFPETVEGALQRVRNAFTRYVGEGSSQTGASRALAQALTEIAENFDVVGDAALVAGGLIASVYAGRTATAIAVTTSALASQAAQFVAARQAAQALAIQERTAAAAVLAQARSHEVAAAAALAEANAHRANVAQLAIYGPVRAAAERQATAAAAEHLLAGNALISADARLVAANAAVTASTSTMAAAQRGLAGAVGFLGGPIGVVTTLLTAGALAWLAWGDKAESAAQKAKRATQEVGEQADAILQRLKKEGSFGTGDLGVLREQASILEKQILVLNQSSGQSPGAAAKLKEKWVALNEITAATEKLITKEAEQANEFKRLAGGQAEDAKKLAKEMEKSIESSIKGYELLAEKSREAWKASLQTEKDYLDQARALEAEATRKPKDSSIEGQANAYLDVIYAQQKLMRLQEQGAALSDVQNQAKLVRELADGLDDQAKAQDAVNQSKLTEAKALRTAAEEQKVSTAGLKEQWDNAQKILADLNTALESVGKKTAINIESEQAKVVLAEITAKLEALKDKTITVTVVPLGPKGELLEKIPAKVPGLATGGPIFGPGHDTSDNLLILGSPGEYMLRAAAVRHYGLPIIEAINNLRLPKFAQGGLLNSVQPIPQIQHALSSAGAERTVNVNFDLGTLGRFPMTSAPDVANGLARALRMAALKLGGR